MLKPQEEDLREQPLDVSEVAMSAHVDDGPTASLLDRLDSLASFNRHVAHDLRGPLVCVTGAAQRAQQLLACGEVAAAAQLLGLLAGRAQDLTKLVSELLALAQAGDAPLQQTTVDLTAIANSAIDEVRLGPQARAGAEIHLHPLPAARGTPALLKQVFVNLVANALKFSQHVQRPLIEIGAAQAGTQRALYVQDNGVGFDAAQAERLFEPFSRLHGKEYAGHGIGLSLVRCVVERHGGRVWATPRAPSGAAFYFTLAGLA